MKFRMIGDGTECRFCFFLVAFRSKLLYQSVILKLFVVPISSNLRENCYISIVSLKISEKDYELHRIRGN